MLTAEKEKTRHSNEALKEIGIQYIIDYKKPQYRDGEYVGTYLIAYLDGIDSWGDNDEWLNKTLEEAQHDLAILREKGIV